MSVRTPILGAVFLLVGSGCGGKSAPANRAVGGAGSTAETTNYVVRQNPTGGVTKIDILLMIDNSLSMGIKQEILAAAVPQLLGRLTSPDCVDPSGVEPSIHLADPVSPCPGNLQREFGPVNDVHVGVVTSSLGDFGGDTCPEPPDGSDPTSHANRAQNDHAWLVGALSRTRMGAPFLAWTSTDASAYPSSIGVKQAEFVDYVKAATEIGCGNEMSLEAWYRFLVDPAPPIDVITLNQGANQRGQVDASILMQRQAFLRPDSLVAILMLSDENDCSMRDTGSYSWVAMTAGAGFRMWRGSSPCASNPNDPCCYSCMLADAGGVSSACLQRDTACRQADPSAKLALADDDVNMRCRMMKRRFGYDFLFPPKRYVNALTQVAFCPDSTYPDLDCECTEAKSKGIACDPGATVTNPLYTNLNPKYVSNGPERAGADSVFLAGIVGVPWQDLAVDPSAAAVLQYKRATTLDWDLFAPKVDEDYSVAVLRDPLMLESAEPRVGTHPITGQALASPDAGQLANSINGHEWYTSRKDLQYACIFSLQAPLATGTTDATRICDLQVECGVQSDSDEYKTCARRFDGCSCTLAAPTSSAPSPLDPTVSHSPLCQAADGSYGNRQLFAKAYPGLRELQVLRGFYEATGGDNSIVGSICPKDLTPANKSSDGYGYNPAIRALVDRLKEKLGAVCLPRRLSVDPATGTIGCAIVEAIPPDASVADPAWCNCEANGRRTPAADLQSSIRSAMERSGNCGASPLPICTEYCFCQLNQLLAGTSDGDRCLNQLNIEQTSPKPGFCYVDPSQGQGSDAMVAGCPSTEKRLIRVVGAADKYLSAPAPGRVYIACPGML